MSNLHVPLWATSIVCVLFFLLGFLVGIMDAYSNAAMAARLTILQIEQQQSGSLQEIVRLLSKSEVAK